MSSFKLGNNEQVTYSFDQDYQLTGIATTSPTRQSLTLGYDPAGNIASIADGSNSNRSQTFQYDALNRVSQAVGFYGTDTPTYDAVGNLASRANSSGSTTYTYDPGSNQVATASTGGSVLSYGYDAAGNQVTRALNGTTQLSIAYNADGRPKTAATETYTYDGFGKRVLIGVPSAGTQNIFDPASGRLLADNNAGGQPQHTYIYLNGIPIALVSGFSSINYVLTDQLGQPQKLVDGFATLTWDRVNDVFGATASQAKGLSTAIALRFPGQEYDAITGLHYNDQRDYDPTLGRYIQPDPIGLAGGINTYSYVRENPLTRKDPRGLCEQATHNYHINMYSPCDAASTFNAYKEAGNSAPGAPAAQEGFTPEIDLTGGNPISQNVDSSNMVITNTTLPGHVFYPGQVIIHVIPDPSGGSDIDITGTGSGPDPLANDFAGYGFFGTGAYAIALTCLTGMPSWGVP
jgi:RHS repeat-associated protein